MFYRIKMQEISLFALFTTVKRGKPLPFCIKFTWKNLKPLTVCEFFVLKTDKLLPGCEFFKMQTSRQGSSFGCVSFVRCLLVEFYLDASV